MSKELDLIQNFISLFAVAIKCLKRQVEDVNKGFLQIIIIIIIIIITITITIIVAIIVVVVVVVDVQLNFSGLNFS